MLNLFGNNYEFQLKIADGHFATIYKGINKKHKVNCCFKIIDLSKLDFLIEDPTDTFFIKPLETFKESTNMCIIKLYDFEIISNHLILSVEYSSEGDLKSYIEKYGYISEQEAIKIFMSIVYGYSVFYYMHKQHFDLNTSNILKVGDQWKHSVSLGFLNIPEYHMFLAPNTEYLAPEVLMDDSKLINYKSDIWSLGILLIEMLTGKRPWSLGQIQSIKNNSHKAINKFDISNSEPYRFAQLIKSKGFPHDIVKNLNKDVIELLESMLVYNQQDRISYEQVIDRLQRIRRQLITANEYNKIMLAEPKTVLENKLVNPFAQHLKLNNIITEVASQDNDQPCIVRSAIIQNIEDINIESLDQSGGIFIDYDFETNKKNINPTPNLNNSISNSLESSEVKDGHSFKAYISQINMTIKKKESQNEEEKLKSNPLEKTKSVFSKSKMEIEKEEAQKVEPSKRILSLLSDVRHSIFILSLLLKDLEHHMINAYSPLIVFFVRKKIIQYLIEFKEKLDLGENFLNDDEWDKFLLTSKSHELVSTLESQIKSRLKLLHQYYGILIDAFPILNQGGLISNMEKYINLNLEDNFSICMEAIIDMLIKKFNVFGKKITDLTLSKLLYTKLQATMIILKLSPFIVFEDTFFNPKKIIKLVKQKNMKDIETCIQNQSEILELFVFQNSFCNSQTSLFRLFSSPLHKFVFSKDANFFLV